MKDGAPPSVAGRDLTLTVLSVLLLVVLIGTSLLILRPFLFSIVWALMLATATWPLLLKLQKRLRSRTLAVVALTLAVLLVFVLPLLAAVQMVADNVDTIARGFQHLATTPIPPPPAWVDDVPLVGRAIAERWTQLAAAGTGALAARAAPHVAAALQWLAASAGSIGLLVIEFVLTLAIAAILYARGEVARDAVLRFGRRLAGLRGEEAVLLAGRAIRAVALGIVVTALVQTLLAGFGLALAGIPFAGLLTAIVLVLCIAQVGPVLVLVPAALWLFANGETGMGSALLVWTIGIAILDNVLRPLLIRSGANLPLLLIFAGVIGGLLAFGIVGLFVGPVVLAVAYTLLIDWIGPPDPKAAIAA